MNLTVKESDWHVIPEQGDAFYRRYGRKPVTEQKETLLEIAYPDGSKDSVLYKYSVKLSFPIEKESFEITEYLESRLSLDGNKIEVLGGKTDCITVNGNKLFPGARFVDAEIHILDRLANRG